MDVKRRNEQAIKIATTIVTAGAVERFSNSKLAWGEARRGRCLGMEFRISKMARVILRAGMPVLVNLRHVITMSLK